MSAARIKRGGTVRKAAPKRKSAPRKASRAPSPLASATGAVLERVPLSHDQAQRVMTVAILGLIAAIAIALASFFGLFAALRQEVALAAGKAGFEVNNVVVRNVDKMSELPVYEIALAEKDRAMPLVDLDALRQDLLRLGWIRDARVSRQLPDTLVIDVVERVPRALWDNGAETLLIDEEGVALERVRRANDPTLLRLAGRNANRRVSDLGKLLDNAPALSSDVVAAEWIGNRRWNLTFRTGEVLALPEGEETAAAALVEFARLEGINRLLGQGVTYFDMRDPTRAYVRKPREPEAPALADGGASE